VILLVETHGGVDHALRHEGDRREIFARDRPDLFELQLFDEVLQGNTPDEPAPGEPDQHRFFGASERSGYDLYIVHGINHTLLD